MNRKPAAGFTFIESKSEEESRMKNPEMRTYRYAARRMRLPRISAVLALFVAAAFTVNLLVADQGGQAGQGTTLVEGYAGGASGAQSDVYTCFTGDTENSTWAYARLDGSGGVVEWNSGVVPKTATGGTVTFVIPCGLGGKGGKVLGAPMQISVDGRKAVTITASVKKSRAWEEDGCRAGFTLLKRDNYNDPFGLLLLTLPADRVRPGQRSLIRVEPKITDPGHDNTYFMLTHVPNVLEIAKAAGGLDELLAGASISLDVARVKRLSQFSCLTGNAAGELTPRNVRLEGSYTYYDGRTDAFRFPQFDPSRPATRVDNFDESMRAGGWVPFADGKLTDGDTATRVVGRPHLLQGIRGWDIVFDLGQEYEINEIEAFAADVHVRNMEVYLKSPNESRWILVHAVGDRKQLAEKFYPELRDPQRLAVRGTARWVRINASFKAAEGGFREILIWGRPLSGELPRKEPTLQNSGKARFESPGPIPLPPPPSSAACPVPQRVQKHPGRFTFTPQTRILTLPGASERTVRTAQVLAADLKEELGLAVTLHTGAAAPDADAIVLWRRNRRRASLRKATG